MPLYLTNAKANAIDDAAKRRIADDITDIHCDVTGAPPVFVHAFFLEDAPHMPLGDRSAMLVGSIRAGRNAEQKAQIQSRIKASFSKHAGFTEDDTIVEIRDTPATWVMEGGEIMPEPGEEAEWLAAHEAKKAQQNG